MIISASRRTDIPLFIGIGFAAHADSSSLLTGKLLGDERITEHGKQTGNLLQE